MSYLDEVAICPYNSNHVFAKSRLFPHLQKCKDAIKSKKPTLFCKNNSSLRFFEEDKQNHYIKCKYCAPDLNSNNIDQIDKNDDSFLNNTDINILRYMKIKNMQEDDHTSQSIHLDLNISEMSQVQDSKFDYTLRDLKELDIVNDSYFMDPKDLVDLAGEIKEKNKDDKTILY
jgi:hypothetical protein